MTDSGDDKSVTPGLAVGLVVLIAMDAVNTRSLVLCIDHGTVGGLSPWFWTVYAAGMISAPVLLVAVWRRKKPLRPES